MKRIICLLFLVSNYISNAEGIQSFSYFPPMDQVYHPVSTHNPEAQKAFDRGITGIYAFNYDAALAGFEEAAELDPEMAMAYWGMAMALDQNLDDKARPIHAELTMFLLKKAQERASKATPREQAYIHALAKRFSPDAHADKAALRKSFSEAMEKVVADYPDDPDAATLYAESLMDLAYWELWELDGTPKENTQKIIDILGNVLVMDPCHLGANHYYIHAVEHSPHPECGLMSAYRLSDLDPKEWGHLLHTTSHIYLRVGDFVKARQANVRGVQADKEYIKKYGLEGNYPIHFLSHNYFYLTITTLWMECYSEAMQAASDLCHFVGPHVEDMPAFETALTMPLQVYLFNKKWEEILAYPEVDKKLPFTQAFRTFARAMAYLHLDHQEEAKKEIELFLKQKTPYLGPEHFLEIAENLLLAIQAKMQGDLKQSEKLYKKAIEKQDLVPFTTWYQPVRHHLGRLYLEEGRNKEAETVFREALQRLPLLPRSLFGLKLALEAQGKEAYFPERAMKDALKSCKKTLNINDL